MHFDALFAEFYKLLEHDDVSVQEVIDVFGKSGHLLSIFVLVLPFCQPIPLPGLSTPLGISISILAVLYLFNRVPQLPKWLGDRKIPQTALHAFVKVIHRILGWIQKIVKPRFAVFAGSELVKIYICVIMIVSGILLALPLPIPFSNTVPAIVILCAAIGYLFKDALTLFLSFLISIGMSVFFWGIFAAASQGWNYIKQ